MQQDPSNRFPSSRASLGVLALALWLGVSGAAFGEELRIGGTGAALGTMRLLAEAFTARNPEIHVTTVPNLGSGGSIKAMLAGAIGLAVTSRPMTETERKAGAVETEYARTPFVFAVATKSRLTAVTTRELADIYAGTMVKWADGSTVRIVLRPRSDTDTDIVKSLSPELSAAVEMATKRPGVRVAVNDQDAADDLERIPGAIGPSSLALILSEKRALRALTLDGREPTTAASATGSYPVHKHLFFVTGATRSTEVEQFIAFVQSPAGREILVRNGQWVP